MTPEEDWRPVPGYAGAYEVSDLGRVRSLDRVVYAGQGRTRLQAGRVLAQAVDHGYCRVNLQGRIKYVHVLVVAAFVGPRPDGLQVCHNNGNPTHNHLGNLRYDTPSENQRDAVEHGRNVQANRTHCPSGHAYDAVNTVWHGGRRYCRPCKRRHQLESYYRKQARKAAQ